MSERELDRLSRLVWETRHASIPQVVTPERQALIEAHKALTHAQRLIDRALGRSK